MTAITLNYVSSEIDFRGLQLRLLYNYSGTMPDRDNVLIIDSYGVPDLRNTSGIRIPLRYDIADWEIDREVNTAKIIARYGIPTQYRIIKGISGYLVSAPAGLVHDDYGNTVGLISSGGVTNNSEVNISGFADINSHGYSAASGHKTIYVDASRPDDTGDGFSWATAKKTGSAALTLLNSQTNNMPHRLLFANGQTYDDGAATSTMTRSGASRASKLWIGAADKGDSSNERPIWKRNQWWFSGDKVHVHGFKFALGGLPSGNASLTMGSTGATAVSTQDCVIDCIAAPGSIPSGGLLIVNRYIFTGEEVSNPLVGGGNGNLGGRAGLEATEIVIANHKTFTASGTGHAIYDIGMPLSTDSRKTGTKTVVQDWMVVRAGLRDIGRARAESQFRSMSRVISQKMGNSAAMGVGNQPNLITCTYNHAAKTLTCSGASTWSSQLAIWSGTYCYANTGTNVVPGKYLLLTGVPGGTTLTLAGSGLGAAADGATNVSVAMGETPGRSRNQNFRHMFSIKPGTFEIGWNVAYPYGLPQPYDTAGFWCRDSATTRRDGGSNPLYPGVSARTSDGDSIAIDMKMERVSLVRFNTQGVDLNYLLNLPQTTLYTQSGIISNRKMLLDHVAPSAGRPIIKISSTENPYHDVNYNVYGIPAGATGFCYTDFAGLNALQNFSSWKSNTGLDTDSVQISTVELNGSTDPNQYPNLDDYDLIRPPVAWGETGTSGTVARLANALASRPLGQWDDSISPIEIVPWLLKQVKPTNRSTWVTAISGSYDYVGAADYSLVAPSSFTESLITTVSCRISWAATTDVKVIGHIIRYGTISGALDQEITVYFDDFVDLTGLAPNTTYYYTITSTDGWNETDQSSEDNFHTSSVSSQSTGRFIPLLRHR